MRGERGSGCRTLLQRDADNPAAQPVIGFCIAANQAAMAEENLSCALSLYDSSGATLPSVHLGKRLAIQWVSGHADMPIGTVPFFYFITTRNGAGVTNVIFVPTKVGSNGFFDLYEVSQKRGFTQTPAQACSCSCSQPPEHQSRLTS